MGSVISSCENCFGDKPDPKSTAKSPVKERPIEEKPKYHTQGTTLHDSLESRDTLRSLKSLQPKPIKKRGASALPRFSKVRNPSQDFALDKDKKYTIKDFDLVKVLGRGSFGKVYLVTKKGEKRYYALKTLKKRDFKTKGQIELVMTEKNVLQNAIHPFIVRLHCSFQSESTLYLVMDFLPGGELLTHLKNRGVFDEHSAKFYAAEIILGLEYLHEELNIIYRDLKPENILVDAIGHIKITDFGLSATGNASRSFCGTLGYVAPEVLKMQYYEEGSNSGEPYGKAVDWWSLGCLLYEMLTGYLPFSNLEKEKMEKDIMENEPNMPYQISDSAKDLLLGLLAKNPEKRLGYHGAEEIKQHPFFNGINWEDMLKLKTPPPIAPNLMRANDLKHFKKEFLNQPAAETPMHNFKLSSNSKEQFPGFTYVPQIE